MAQRIGMMMSIITIIFVGVTLVAIVRGIYIVRQKQRESKLREMMYFSKMKADREKKKAEQIKQKTDEKDECDTVEKEIVKKNEVKEENVETEKREIELDWLTGEPIYKEK